MVFSIRIKRHRDNSEYSHIYIGSKSSLQRVICTLKITSTILQIREVTT